MQKRSTPFPLERSYMHASMLRLLHANQHFIDIIVFYYTCDTSAELVSKPVAVHRPCPHINACRVVERAAIAFSALAIGWNFYVPWLQHEIVKWIFWFNLINGVHENFKNKKNARNTYRFRLIKKKRSSICR